jgi:hypothetical protein
MNVYKYKGIKPVGKCQVVFLGMAFGQKNLIAMVFKNVKFYSDVFLNADESPIRTML